MQNKCFLQIHNAGLLEILFKTSNLYDIVIVYFPFVSVILFNKKKGVREKKKLK